jgi:SAM-dependent methyltransferase
MSHHAQLCPASLKSILSRLYWNVYKPLSRRGLPDLLGSSQTHWVRVVMERETRKWIEGLAPGRLDTLEISGNAWERRCQFRSFKSVRYPDFDVCQSVLKQQFDLVIAEQVFEHLLWPYRAARNIHEMLRPGGFLLLTTPFLVRVHYSPVDCSRWTETGLKHFLAECGFGLESTRTGSWGNRRCVIGNLTRWINYHPLFHSLRNESMYPVMIWALAQKDSAEESKCGPNL